MHGISECLHAALCFWKTIFSTVPPNFCITLPSSTSLSVRRISLLLVWIQASFSLLLHCCFPSVYHHIDPIRWWFFKGSAGCLRLWCKHWDALRGVSDNFTKTMQVHMINSTYSHLHWQGQHLFSGHKGLWNRNINSFIIPGDGFQHALFSSCWMNSASLLWMIPELLHLLITSTLVHKQHSTHKATCLLGKSSVKSSIGWKTMTVKVSLCGLSWCGIISGSRTVKSL